MNLDYNMHQVFYTAKARQGLRDLEINTAKRIIKKIHFFSLQKNLLSFAKNLTDSAIGQYRFRIGDYRAIFDLDKKGNVQILMILRIKHRKDIYNI